MVYVSIRLYFNSLQWIQNKTSSSGGSAFRWSVSEGKRRALLEVTCLSLPFHLFFGLSCICFDKSRPQLWTGFLTVGAITMHRIGRSDLPNDAPPPLQVEGHKKHSCAVYSFAYFSQLQKSKTQLRNLKTQLHI